MAAFRIRNLEFWEVSWHHTFRIFYNDLDCIGLEFWWLTQFAIFLYSWIILVVTNSILKTRF